MPRVEAPAPAPAPALPERDPTPADPGARAPSHIPDPPRWSDRVLAFVAAVEPTEHSRDADTTRRIRAFYDTFNVRIPSRGDRIAVPFRINDDDPACARELHARLKGDPAARFIDLVVVGRGTPAQMTAIVQALDRRDPTLFHGSADSVRAELSRLGIGIDCAGSVQLAIFASVGLDERTGPRAMHFRARVYDNFSGLDRNSAFVGVADPADLRPGDVMVLGPPRWEPYGHKAIVAACRRTVLSAEDAARLTPARAIPPGRDVVLVDVASSWGGDGPGEHTWAFDPQSGAWASVGMGRSVSGEPMDHPGGGPWDHPLRGMFRVAARTFDRDAG